MLNFLLFKTVVGTNLIFILEYFFLQLREAAKAQKNYKKKSLLICHPPIKQKDKEFQEKA